MKFAIALCLISLALVQAAPADQKRFLQSIFGTDVNPFDLTILRCDLQKLLDVVGTDPAETACEAECHILLRDDSIFDYGCTPLCKSFQQLVHTLHITQGTDDCTGGNQLTTQAA